MLDPNKRTLHSRDLMDVTSADSCLRACADLTNSIMSTVLSSTEGISISPVDGEGRGVMHMESFESGGRIKIQDSNFRNRDWISIKHI